MNKQNINKAMLYRLIVFNIFFIFIITVVQQTVNYYYSKNIITEQIESMNKMAVSQTKSHIDQLILKDVIDFSQNYFSEYIGDKDLLYPIRNKLQDNSLATINLIRELQKIKLDMPLVDSFYLYYIDQNILATENQVIYQNVQDKKTFQFPEVFQLFKNSENNAGYYLLQERADRVAQVSYVSTVPLIGNKAKANMFVAVNININKINALLSNLSKESLYIMDSNGKIFANNRNLDEDSPEILLIENKMIYKTDNADNFTLEINNKKSILLYSKSDQNDWTYISRISLPNYYDKLYDFTNISIFSLLIYLILNIILVYFVNLKSFKPIEIKLTSLQKSIEKNKPIMRHHFLIELLSGRFAFENDYEKKLELFDFTLTNKNIFCFVINLIYEAGENIETQLIFPYDLLSKLETKHPLCNIAATKDTQDYISGVVFYNSIEDQEEVIRHLLSVIEESIEIQYAVGIGNTYSHTEREIAISYKEANEAIDYYFLSPLDKVYIFNKLPLNHQELKKEYYLPIEDISSAIIACDSVRLNHLIYKILEQLLEGQYSTNYVKMILRELIITITKTIKNMGYDPLEIFKTDIRNNQSKNKNIDAYKTWLDAMLGIGLKNLSLLKVTLDQDIGYKIQNFIANNIYNDISLELLAQHINVTPTYLSKLFKQYMSSTFTDYVTGVKLQLAVEMLTEGKLTVNDIALKLGYNSTQHFINLFKRRYGVTPKQYQKNFLS